MKKYLTGLCAFLMFCGFTLKQEKFTIFMIGDSTMADKNLEKDKRERGWGMYLPEFLSDKILVENHAVNGRSTKSFRSKGHWKNVVERIKPGDYVFIQFGHNDTKADDTTRFTNPDTEFRANLIRYIDETRSKGGKPVLFTSIARRKFDQDGKLVDTHGRYLEVTREVADEKKVPLIDHTVSTHKWIESLGPETSKSFFMWLAPGESLADVAGKQDNTHLVEPGAREVARLAAEEIRVKCHDLSPYINVEGKTKARYYAPNQSKLAFPGAEGFGKYVQGGRGGKVIYVTNLNDSGQGSLREAIETKGPRTVLFKLSGTIDLKSPLVIDHSYITLAGQSAPGDGICIAGYPVKLEGDHIIIRYLRFRLGDTNKVVDDAITSTRRKNVIIDHCSMSWATDECASFYDNESFTLQWCLISESLTKSVHYKGNHGYAGIWGGKGASFHHNLIVHHSSRNPRFCGARYHEATAETEWVDFCNNVIYNWGFNSSYGGENGNHNMINNYYKPGPATKKNVNHRIMEISQSQDRLGFHDFGNFYINGNVMEGNTVVTADNWDGGVDFNIMRNDKRAEGVIDFSKTPENYAKLKTLSRLHQPLNVLPVSLEPAHEAYEKILMDVGASKVRDAVDMRVIDDVKKGRFLYGDNGLIDTQDETEGYPLLKSLKAPVDSDEDGIPDEWEKKYKLNPGDISDGANYTLSPDYTNLEVYLNSLITQ